MSPNQSSIKIAGRATIQTQKGLIVHGTAIIGLAIISPWNFSARAARIGRFTKTSNMERHYGWFKNAAQAISTESQ
jgi:hypothetical protein